MSLGRYPLQVEQAVSNPVTRLVPGVTSVTVHARYYALHGLLAHQAAEENLSGPEAQTLLRRCEVVMGAASLVDDSATATFYGRPHGADAMQQVSSGGNLDVDAVSCRGAYSSSDWGFRGPYLGAERVLGIVDAGTTWKPGKRYDHNAARPVLGALLELAAQPTVSAAQLRQVAPAVSIYRCAGAPDGLWLAELLCRGDNTQDRRRRTTLQLLARVMDTRAVPARTAALNESFREAVAFGDFITTDPLPRGLDEAAMWRGVLLRNFSVSAWRRLWAWLVDQVCDGAAVTDDALAQRVAEELPAGTVADMLAGLPDLRDADGNPAPAEQAIRAQPATEPHRDLQILAAGALRAEQLEGITRTVFTRAIADDLDPVWMRERLRHAGPQSLPDFGGTWSGTCWPKSPRRVEQGRGPR